MCESRLLHLEIIVLQFESALLVFQTDFCTSKVYLFISKVYFILFYCESTSVHFESILLYVYF